MKSLLSLLLTIVFLHSSPGYPLTYGGQVLDALTNRPIKDARVTLSDHQVVRTDANGVFQFEGGNHPIAVRASGYRRGEPAVSPEEDKAYRIKLMPFTPKALYLSFYGIGTKALRQPVLKLIEETELNALAIDIKGDRGMIAYQSSVPLAAEIGAQKISTIRDIHGLLRTLQGQGIYTIARIVVFKDNPLALARPDLAVKTRDGAIWRDREGLAWTDPFSEEVWAYNIAVAEEAAQNGFDEIQFDYARFPDARRLRFSEANTQENRIKAITGFFDEARKRLAPYNVFLAADIFGYVCWNLNDTDIGQKLEELAPLLDYISPMLYPSGFQYGIPGYRNPVAHPYEIVSLSLKRAKERTGLPGVHFRPWLQAFRDYAFDGRPFTGREIRVQIRATEDQGSHGWMLWNPRNIYSAEGLSK